MAKNKICIGTYNGEEISVSFTDTFQWENDDRVGVPGHWFPLNNIQLQSLDILGVEIPIESLPEALQAAIWALAEEVDWVDDDA